MPYLKKPLEQRIWSRTEEMKQKRNWNHKPAIPAILPAIVLILLSLCLTACNLANSVQPKTFTVGVVNLTSGLESSVAGFKAGMTEFGYVEGENITYIYDGPTNSIDGLADEAEKLVSAGVDLIFSVSTPAAVHAKAAVTGTDIPVVFSPVNDSLQAGLVDSLPKPGGNLTGVQVSGFVPKQLEWLLKISPDIKQIWVPHNPDDASSVQGLTALRETATTLSVDLVVAEVRNLEEVTGLITSAPQDVEAIYILPDNLVSSRIDDFITLAIERGLPISSSTYAANGSLLSYGPDFFEAGKQAARLADQILKGAQPSDLPVETADFFLVINQQTAQALELDVPEDVLRAANEIIR